MAEEHDTPVREGGTRIPWLVMGGLILLFVIGSIVFQKKEKETKITEGARAVAVPTDDVPRTVVVPPCNPPTEINRANASAQIAVPGATAVKLPRGVGLKNVVVPKCTVGKPGSANLPSAAFVLADGEKVVLGEEAGTKKKKDTENPAAQGIKAQLVLRPKSRTRTIIVPRCLEDDAGTPPAAGGSQSVIVDEPKGGSTIAVAPRC